MTNINIKRNLAIKYAEYMTSTESTIRESCKMFNVSKTKFHYIIKLYLPEGDLRDKYSELADTNFSNKHLKGGASTKLKYSVNK